MQREEEGLGAGDQVLKGMRREQSPAGRDAVPSTRARSLGKVKALEEEGSGGVGPVMWAWRAPEVEMCVEISESPGGLWDGAKPRCSASRSRSQEATVWESAPWAPKSPGMVADVGFKGRSVPGAG